MGIKNLTQKIGATCKKYLPEILMSVGVSGLLTSTLIVADVSPKVSHKIEMLKREKGKLKFKDKVKASKLYIIPTILSVGGATCCVMSARIYRKKTIILATSLAASEATLTALQQKTLETVGKTTYDTIKASVDKEVQPEIKNKEIVYQDVPVGRYDVYEMSTGRKLPKKMTDQEILAVQNSINEDILNSVFGQKTLNDYYTLLDLDETDLGTIPYWDTNHTCRIDIDSRIADGVPEYLITPKNYMV